MCVRVSLDVQEYIVKSHLIIIIKPELSIFLFVVIFFRVCVYIYVPGKLDFLLFYYSAVLWCTQLIGYFIAQLSLSFACRSHYLVIINMQTYMKVLNFKKNLSQSQKCLRISIISIIFREMYGPMCIKVIHFSYDDCENMCVLYLIIIINSEVRPICHCLGSGHETTACTVGITYNSTWCMHYIFTWYNTPVQDPAKVWVISLISLLCNHP